jgi:hypothetical protein
MTFAPAAIDACTNLSTSLTAWLEIIGPMIIPSSKPLPIANFERQQ